MHSYDYAADSVPAEKTILLVEDNADVRLLITRILSPLGVITYHAKNGLEAIQFAADLTPDMILMDIRMPGLDGYSAVRRIRFDGYSGKIVALTAEEESEYREKCLEAGFDEFFSKPLSRARLTDYIRENLGITEEFLRMLRSPPSPAQFEVPYAPV
ncbi:MAG: response regulator [Bdellovibrionota bacterium]